MTASPQGDQPPDFFNLLLTDSILELAVREDDRFAEELKAQYVAPKARIVKWKPLTKEEFLAFLGVLYHMETIRLNRIGIFFRKDFLFNFPCFRRCMSRDRFSGILQCLHLSPYDTYQFIGQYIGAQYWLKYWALHTVWHISIFTPILTMKVF